MTRAVQGGSRGPPSSPLGAEDGPLLQWVGLLRTVPYHYHFYFLVFTNSLPLCPPCRPPAPT